MNILKVAKKQAEKGMSHIDNKGEFINAKDPKFKKVCMKEFLASVKSGELPVDISFKEYFEDTIDRMLPIDCLPEMWASSLFDREMARNMGQFEIPDPSVGPAKEGDNPC